MNEKVDSNARMRGVRPAVTSQPQVVQKIQIVERIPRFVFIYLAFFLLVFLGVSFFAWKFYTEAKKSPAPFRTDDKTTVIQHISNHVLLPTGEEPVFATVTDPAKLSDQPFFVNAQTGDKVLVFTKAKRAILYRPGTDRIIEMMPIDLGSTDF